MSADALRCPRCGEPATLAHIKASPECAKSVQTLCARYRLAQRKTVTRAGGRPRKLIACPRCGKQVSVLEARSGHDQCEPKRRRRKNPA